MERNIEQAIAGAREEASARALIFHLAQESLNRDLGSHWTRRLLYGKVIRGKLDSASTAQRDNEAMVARLNTIKELSFTQDGGWILQAQYRGSNIDIQKRKVNGRSLYSVKVDGEVPHDEAYKGFAHLYSSAVGMIQDEIKLQEVQEEIEEVRKKSGGRTRERGTTNQRTDQQAINPKDQLGYFKVLGMDPEALEGLSEEEIVARIKANYRVSAMHAHPDKQAGTDDTRMVKLNKAQDVLLDPNKRYDYMNRKGDFDPRRAR